MQLYVGTSGYSYKEWRGAFYPKDMLTDGMLRFYGEHFNTVEINNTFFRMPKPDVLEAWVAEVPGNFKFVLKASRGITHMKRLKNAGESVAYLLNMIEGMKQRIGALLFQLPPNMKKDLPRLREFLPLLQGRRAAFEFRHQSWFENDVFAALREHNAALCIAEAEDDLDIPFVATADFGYLRLRMPEYTDAQLKAWQKRVKDQNWSDALVFFKHEDEAKGPKLANRFMELAK